MNDLAIEFFNPKTGQRIKIYVNGKIETSIEHDAFEWVLINHLSELLMKNGK